jgi:uncharacterized membrane protein
MKWNVVASLPVCYTAYTRIQTVAGGPGYLLQEILPLVVATCWFKLDRLPKLAILYVLWITVYEFGYLWNDYRDCRLKGEQNRLLGVAISFWVFGASHILAGAILLGILSRMFCWSQVAYVALINLSLLGLVMFHSSSQLRKYRYARLASFSGLAFYKYAPTLLPLLGYRLGSLALICMFFFYGLARLCVYVLRKCGRPMGSPEHIVQAKIQVGFLILAAPLLVVETAVVRNRDIATVLSLWVTYVIGTGVLWLGRQLKASFVAG